MAKLHHMTLKAAVDKYSSLHAEGKSEDEVKASITGDEKGFDTDEVNEIYATIIGGTDNTGNTSDNKSDGAEKPKTTDKYIVKTEFRDIKDFSKVHAVGADVSHFDAERLKGLVDRGLVKKA